MTGGVSQFRLTKGESMILAAMQAYLMQKDIHAEEKDDRRRKKQEDYNAFTRDGKRVISELALGHTESWGGTKLTGESWEMHFPAIVAGSPDPNILSTAAPLLATHVTERARGMLLLIELYSFHPWSEKAKWNAKVHAQSLKDLTNKMPCMTESDYQRVDTEFKRVVRRLQRKSVSWRKFASIAAVGAILGILTMGLAAPVIGAAIGGAMGLSGAAATSAGLALLGGGSMAAGGFGMAGGTALLVGLGGTAGGIAATGSGYARGMTGKKILAESIKLELLIKLVIVQQGGGDEQARFVVVGLEMRLREVEEKLAELAKRLEAEKSLNKQLRHDLKSQQQEYELAKIQLEEMIKEHSGVPA